MTAAQILTELRRRGVTLTVEGQTLRYRAPKGALTPELRRALVDHKAELMAALGNVDLVDASEPAAVLLHSNVLDHAVWLVADAAVLAEHPDIKASGFPIFFFDEVDRLRHLSVEDLRLICTFKVEYPGARMVQ